MGFISTEPGYQLPEEINEMNIDERLIYKDSLILGHLSEKDILVVQVPITEKIEDLISWIDNMAPTDAEPLARSGFSKAFTVEHNPFALHFAAKDGDVEKMQRLIEQGYEVNAEPEKHLSARPLHFAAFAGNANAVSLLLNLGADVNDGAYGGNTALHLALKNHHYQVACLLVQQGANPQQLNGDGKNPISYLLADLYDHVVNAKASDSLAAIQEIIDTIGLFSTTAQEALVSSDSFTNHNGQLYYAPLPVVTELKIIASHASTETVQKQVLRCAEDLAKIENGHQSYLSALNLMHRFPTGGVYELSLNENKTIHMVSEGHFSLFTTELAKDSLGAYLQTISNNTHSKLEKDIFNSVYQIYERAAKYCANAHFESTYQDANTHFHLKDTVLLPSGWRGHFVDVILSKAQELYATANSGDRYNGEPDIYDQGSSEPGLESGLLFYALQEPNKIDEAFMQNTLNNGSRSYLEFDQQLRYGLSHKVFEIHNPDQEFGNCGWESHRDAVEGIIFIELLNKKVPVEEATHLAKEFYHGWDQFHGHYVIDQYMAHKPGLEAQALVDIFKQLQCKPTTEMPEVVLHKNASHAQKIVDVLQSEKYIEGFKAILVKMSEDLPTNHEILDKLKQDYHVDVDTFVHEAQQTEHANATEVVAPQIPDMVPMAHEHGPSPFFNIAHQMLAEPALHMPEIVL
ncbi:MAG: ankyrin repeat domain-containing protein [Proteobacteria bacterium]|nr:ankyrin repeat domain-containing protein [Pseudomonadota bacterium]